MKLYTQNIFIIKLYFHFSMVFLISLFKLSHEPMYKDEYILIMLISLMFHCLRGSLNKFLDFFRMGTFIDSTYMKL